MWHAVVWQTAVSCLQLHGGSGPIREVTCNMSNKSVGVALGRAVYKKGGEKSIRQKRKEMGIRKTARKGGKNKHGLWKGTLQGAVNRSDIEGSYKDEGREKPNHICPLKKTSSVPSGCRWQSLIAWSGRLTSLFTWSDSGVNLYCLLDKVFHTARFPARKHTQLQSINIIARKYASIHKDWAPSQ